MNRRSALPPPGQSTEANPGKGFAALSFLWRGVTRPAGHAISPQAKRHDEALRLVRLFSTLSVPTGLMPLPLTDVLVATTLQMRLIARLAKLYNVPFSHNLGRVLVGALLLGGPQGLATGVVTAMIAASSLTKTAIGPGTVIGGLALGVLQATVTFALGQVFIEHFESGGTLLDFDVDAARPRFLDQFQNARAGWRLRWRPRGSKTKSVDADTQPLAPKGAQVLTAAKRTRRARAWAWMKARRKPS